MNFTDNLRVSCPNMQFQFPVFSYSIIPRGERAARGGNGQLYRIKIIDHKYLLIRSKQRTNAGRQIADQTWTVAFVISHSKIYFYYWVLRSPATRQMSVNINYDYRLLVASDTQTQENRSRRRRGRCIVVITEAWGACALSPDTKNCFIRWLTFRPPPIWGERHAQVGEHS